MRMNIKQAAEYTGLKESTIYHYIAERKIPFLKIGARVVFDSEDLNKWLAEMRVEVVK